MRIVQKDPEKHDQHTTHCEINQPARSRIKPLSAYEDFHQRRQRRLAANFRERRRGRNRGRGVRRGGRVLSGNRGWKRIGIHWCLGHGKTLGPTLIRRFLAPDDVGKPQFIAAGLLVVYLLQCLWLIRVASGDSERGFLHALRVFQGLQQWRGGPIAGTPGALQYENLPPAQFPRARQRLRINDAFDPDHSPLYYLIAAAPLAPYPGLFTTAHPTWRWLAVTPYLFFGVMLGGSLWYVTRRLYGNAGGYIALALYCFSPAMIFSAAEISSLAEMGAVWGAFGAVWTAVAVAHTLYAPREVVLWNWRRILLLGLSFALAVGNQFSLSLLALVALLLMLWVAPVRKRAVLVIWGAACAFALLLMFASYFFHPLLFGRGMMQAAWLRFEPRALVMSLSYYQGLRGIFLGSPPLMLALPVALAAYLGWKRSRYFGNTAPLAIALLLFILGTAAAPQFSGHGFHLAALVFLFVFVAGVFADLLETRHGLIVTAGLSALLIASAIWNLLQLARL